MKRPKSLRRSLEASLLEPNLKASDRVRLFIEAQLKNSNLQVGDRLPGSRALADHLNVSITTVQAVLRDLAAKGIIRTTVGSGSYLNAPLAEPPAAKTLRIGLSFGIASSGPWSTAISGAIIRKASGLASPVSIHPVQIPHGPPAEVLEALKQQEGKVDAMILHPVLDGVEVAAREADLAYPVVHLNPGFTTASTNFVSSDFYSISQQLGAAWAATGRKRILFVHNSGERMNASAALRCFGLVAGLGNHIGNEIDFRIVSGDLHSEEAGYELARTAVAQNPPDAIYLVGDALAIGFCHYLAEVGLKIPEEVSVVAGSGIAEHRPPYRDLTRTRQPAEAIGESLLEMARALAEGETAELPGRYLPCTFIGGQTTREEENRRLNLPELRQAPALSSRSRAAGFTVVEMLVVLAVVVVLVALLFPVASGASGHYKRTACSANLKTLGVAAHLYAADRNGLLPGILTTPAQDGQPANSHAGEQWDVQIMPYLGIRAEATEAESRTPFYCIASTRYPGAPLSRQLSYAWNSRLIEAAPYSSRKLTDLQEPATTLLALDNKLIGDQPDRNGLTFQSAGNTIYINNNLNQLKRVAYERHVGRVNILFADGSVAARKPVSATDPTPRGVRFYNKGPLSPGS